MKEYKYTVELVAIHKQGKEGKKLLRGWVEFEQAKSWSCGKEKLMDKYNNEFKHDGLVYDIVSVEIN